MSESSVRCIIAGGRNVRDYKALSFAMDVIHSCINITEVVSGTARGADKLGEKWAESRGIPVRRFPAQWKDTGRPDAIIRRGKWGLYDAGAGFRRNAEMAEHATHCVLFPGGNGTADTETQAIKRGLWICKVRKIRLPER